MAVVEALSARLYRAVGDWRKHGEGADQLLALALWCTLGPQTLQAVADNLARTPITNASPMENHFPVTIRAPDRNPVPALHEPTIEHMEALFPERSPDPADSEREVWMKAGERRAVQRLRNLLAKQERQPAIFGVRV